MKNVKWESYQKFVLAVQMSLVPSEKGLKVLIAAENLTIHDCTQTERYVYKYVIENSKHNNYVVLYCTVKELDNETKGSKFLETRRPWAMVTRVKRGRY